MAIWIEIAIIILLAIFGYISWKQFLGPLAHIPGPIGLPIVGNIIDLTKSVNFVKLSEWSQEYGPVYKFTIFSKQIVVISGTAALKEAMLERGEHFAGRAPFFRAEYFTDGYQDIVFCSYNERVKAMRKFIHTHLHLYGSGMQNIEAISLEELQDLINRLTVNVGMPMDPLDYLHDSILAIMFIILFGYNPNKESEEFHLLKEASRKGPKAMGFVGSGVLLDMMPWLRFFGNSAFKVLDQIKTNYKLISDKAVDRYENGDGHEDGGMVSAMIANMKRGFLFESVHIKTIILDMMGAGNLTTLSSFGSTFNILVHNSNVQRKLQAEVDAVVGSGRMVQLKDQDHMPYTIATVLELIRYVTPTPLGIPRLTLEDTEVSGIFIPKNTQVFMNLWDQHHSKSIWTEPFEFHPDRFLNEDGQLLLPDHPNRAAFMGFGYGVRRCLGENLALTRIFLFLANLMKRFSVLPASNLDKQPSCHPADMTTGAILLPPTYKVRFKQRT